MLILTICLSLSPIIHSDTTQDWVNSSGYLINYAKIQKHYNILVIYIVNIKSNDTESRYCLHTFDQSLPCLYAVLPTGCYACLSLSTFLLCLYA